MVQPADRNAATVTRRSVIGAAATLAIGGTSGCIQRTRSLLGRRSRGQLSLEVKTVPADEDQTATRIARELVTNLEAVGIDASVVLESEDELRRSTLINREFDLYVSRYPDHHDPDFLRPMLHSVFAEEAGLQNPFGFVDISIDELLNRQRTTQSGGRRRAVHELLRSISQLQPFTVIAFPDDIRAVRSDQFTGWRTPGLSSPLGYLSLRRTEPNATDEGQLRVTTTDRRITRNLNPIAVEFRSRGVFTGLLYDPLAYRIGGNVRPWLAEGWTWSDAEDGGTVARLQLRPDLTWHDGHRLSVDDVAFTYAFLEDTSLGKGSVSAPTPRFRGRASLVETVDVIDDRTVEFRFGDTDPAVAIRAFTIPVFPEHEWRPKSVPVGVAGVELFEGVTEALVWDNPNPVGSGPLQFEQSIADELLVFNRFDDHFLRRRDAPVGRFNEGISFDRLVVRVAPSDSAAVELVAIDEADATASNVGSTLVPTIARQDNLQLIATPSRAFYLLGFNTRREPLGNPRLRMTIARLIDKAFVVDTIFGGFATPSASPLGGTEWEPSDLQWDGVDPVAPFVGTDGNLDVEAAMDLFREIGYQYDSADRLLDR